MKRLVLLLATVLVIGAPQSVRACASCIQGEWYPTCTFNWLGSQWCWFNYGQCVEGGGFCVIFIPDGSGKLRLADLAKPADVRALAVAQAEYDATHRTPSTLTIEQAFAQCRATPGCQFQASPEELARLTAASRTWGSVKLIYR